MTIKRSNCASGKRYVPSWSIGFCVAITKNGGASVWVIPSTVTCRSSITSNNAACVFAGARLISSIRTKLEKTGPEWKENSAVFGLKTDVPTTSDGIKSGVN